MLRSAVLASLTVGAVVGTLPVLGGCGEPRDRGASARQAAIAAACGTLTTHVTGAIAWIEDDYASALACARAREVPLVLDLWAPWCHTCLSMQSAVLPDPSFLPLADRFVFASLDTDREGNAAAVAAYPLSAWPTFYVVSSDEAVLARFVGAASVPQFHAFLYAGASAATSQGVAGPAALLLDAERALADEDLVAAETALTAALAAAPPGWVRGPDALGSLIHTRARRGDVAGCVTLAETSLDATGAAASATDFLGTALGCANKLAIVDAPRAAAFRARARARLEGLLADPSAQLSVDDRSDAMVYVRELLEAAGDKPAAIATAEKQRQLLEDAAAQAPSPHAAMTYNWQRAEVHVYLGRPLDIVAALERSAADLPGEYDPPARLGWIYLKAGKLAEAERWTDVALALSYGPRKARFLTQRADIAAAQGDRDGEFAARDAVVALWTSLPPSQASPEALAKAHAMLAALVAAGPRAAPGPGAGAGPGSASEAGSGAGPGSGAGAGHAPPASPGP